VDQGRDAVEVAAMDGVTGFKTAAVEEFPDAVAVIWGLLVPGRACSGWERLCLGRW
jgi:hypothetical protein